MRMNTKVAQPIGFAALNAACVNMAIVGAGQPNYVTATQCIANQPKREITMIDQEIEQRRYLLNRVCGVQSNKNRDLEKSFGLLDDNRPNSPEDLIKRIQDGQYVLTSKDEFDDEDDDFCGYTFDRLHWRDPATVRDQDGYKAAFKRLTDAGQKLQDKVRLQSIADAFKAFEEFEATNFAVN